MEFRYLGNSGLKISEITYGNWLTHGSQVENDVASQCVRAALDEGARRGLFVAPRQVRTVVGQLDEWLTGPYFTTFVAAGPDNMRGELSRAAGAADGAVAAIRDYLRDEYAPRAEGTPDAVGRDPVREQRGARIRSEGQCLGATALGESEVRFHPPDERMGHRLVARGAGEGGLGLREELVRGREGELDVELVDKHGLDGIAYTPRRDDAVATVDRGAADVAFLLRGLRVDEIFDLARRGGRMPPKSTYFFPKPLSGLLFHPLDR